MFTIHEMLRLWTHKWKGLNCSTWARCSCSSVKKRIELPHAAIQSFSLHFVCVCTYYAKFALEFVLQRHSTASLQRTVGLLCSIVMLPSLPSTLVLLRDQEFPFGWEISTWGRLLRVFQEHPHPTMLRSDLPRALQRVHLSFLHISHCLDIPLSSSIYRGVKIWDGIWYLESRNASFSMRRACSLVLEVGGEVAGEFISRGVEELTEDDRFFSRTGLEGVILLCLGTKSELQSD